jgi:CTP-dependent riboflavin kinase
MPIFSGVVFDGAGHGHTPRWFAMHLDILANTGWSRVEPGTMNVRLADYAAYTGARRVDFPASRLVTGEWDCNFQRCEIRRQGGMTNVPAIIATPRGDFWGTGGFLVSAGRQVQVPGGAVEIMSDRPLRNTLGIVTDDSVEIILP